MRASWEPLDFGPRSKYCIIVSRVTLVTFQCAVQVKTGNSERLPSTESELWSCLYRKELKICCLADLIACDRDCSPLLPPGTSFWAPCMATRWVIRGESVSRIKLGCAVCSHIGRTGG